MVQSRNSVERLAAYRFPLPPPLQGHVGQDQQPDLPAGENSTTFHSTQQSSTDDADPPFDPWSDRSRPSSPSYIFGAPSPGSKIDAEQPGKPPTLDDNPDMQHIILKQQQDLLNAINDRSPTELTSRPSRESLIAAIPAVTPPLSMTTNSASASARPRAWHSGVADSSDDSSKASSVAGVRSAMKELFSKRSTPRTSASERVTAAKDATVASNFFEEKSPGHSPAAPYRIPSKRGNGRGKGGPRKKKGLFFEADEEQNLESAMADTVFVKHSSAFNSDRHSGMTKREQLEYVEKLQVAIVGNARVVWPKDSPIVLISKTENMKNSPFFVSVPQYTANLISFFEGEIFQQLLAQSAEHETVVDAVEDLHDQATTMLGERLAGLKITDIIEIPTSDSTIRKKASAENEQARRLGSGRGIEDEPMVNVFPPSDEEDD